MTNKKLKYIVFLLISLSISCTSMPEKIRSHCIKGIITGKAKPELSHGAMNIEFINFCDSAFTWFSVYNNDEKFWNYLSVGDSLFKEKDTLLIRVKKPHESKWFRLTKW